LEAAACRRDMIGNFAVPKPPCWSAHDQIIAHEACHSTIASFVCCLSPVPAKPPQHESAMQANMSEFG
jgi:hypothetical protein